MVLTLVACGGALFSAAAMQKAEVAKREAQVQIQKAQYLAEQERLNAEEVVREEIEKRKIEIAAEAEGYASLVTSCHGDAKAAATFLMVEKIEEVVAKQVEAIRNLKIDKITVWDSGNGDGKGSSTANFMSNLIKSVPPLQDVASMAGVELPEFLSRMTDQAAAPEAKAAKPEA